VLRELGVDVVVADVRDRETLLDHASGCDLIAHTAAQPAMTISCEDPELDFTTNVKGTFHVLEAARAHDVPVASCSTVHVYGPWINDELVEAETRYTRQPETIAEDAPILAVGRVGKLSPLHASKAAGELYSRSFADMYGVRAASFRYTGIYGPRQFGGEDHGWVANFALRAALGWPITIYGSGKQVRDVLYASDAAAAFVAWQRNPVPGVFNVGGGPGHAISLLECLALIGRLLGRPPELRFAPARDGDLAYFVCDTARARAAFAWTPRVAPDAGVAGLLGWIEANRMLFESARHGG
jgi:CDP-paratose 2-epimerase